MRGLLAAAGARGGGLLVSLVVRFGDEPLLYVFLPALKTLMERIHR